MAVSSVVSDWPRCGVQTGSLLSASGHFDAEKMNFSKSSNVCMFHHLFLCTCVTVPTGSLCSVWLALCWLASRCVGRDSFDAASEHLIGGCSAT